ncbi:hypothetical protein QNN00_21140 [Bacillus velezensis]|nr:hypothetical protein [Bacillus velezensis]
MRKGRIKLVLIGRSELSEEAVSNVKELEKTDQRFLCKNRYF